MNSADPIPSCWRHMWTFSKNVFVLVFHISFKEETIGQDYNGSHVCYCLLKEEKVGIYDVFGINSTQLKILNNIIIIGLVLTYDTLDWRGNFWW